MTEPHTTTPVQVWADVDIGISKLVETLNRIDGVRTHTSCQGSIEEGGAAPYPAFIRVSWHTDKAKESLYAYGLREEGETHGVCYPSVDLLRSLY